MTQTRIPFETRNGIDQDASGTQLRNLLGEILMEPDRIDRLLVKVLTDNDDSGRHGVLVPSAAYGFFGDWEAPLELPGANHTRPISTIRRDINRRVKSSLKYYQRYPERRITALRFSEMVHSEEKPKGSAILVARRTDSPDLYEIHLLDPGKVSHRTVLGELGLLEAEAGDWKILSPDVLRPQAGEGLQKILAGFDRCAGQWVPYQSQTKATNGVGLLAQKIVGMVGQDNRSGPDVMATELKGMLATDLESAKDADLFLKEPRWLDGLSQPERVRSYGYVDNQGRPALKVAVNGLRTNPQGLRLHVEWEGDHTALCRKAQAVGRWDHDILQDSLSGKMQTTVYALAKRRKVGGRDEFLYHTLVLAQEPEALSLAKALEAGDAVVQLRMHVMPGGRVRNHGTQFRIKLGQLVNLFGFVSTVRDYT